MNHELTNLLSGLAQKLGTTVEYLWPKLVKYEFVCSTSVVVGFGIAAVIASVLAIIGFKRLMACEIRLKPERSRSVAEDNAVVSACMWFWIPLIAFLFCSVISATGIPGMVVPEAKAIKTLLSIGK